MGSSFGDSDFILKKSNDKTMRSIFLSVLLIFLLTTSAAWGEATASDQEKAPAGKEALPESQLKARIGEGTRLMKEKRWEEAARFFEALAKKFPDQEEIYFRLGVSYLELRQIEKAEETLKRAVRLNPEYVPAFLQLARLYEETQRLQEALNLYETIIHLDPKGEAVQFSLVKKSLIEGILLARSGDFDGALRLFKAAAELDPSDPAAFYNMGLIYLRRKEEAKAEEAFRKAVEANSHHQEAYLQLANLYEQQKRLDEALSAYIGAAEANPNTPGGRAAQIKIPFLKGITFAKHGKPQEALLAFQQALRISPDPAPIYYNIALLYLGVGDLENAQAALTRTLQVDPRHQGALLNLGILYERQGKLEEALRSYEGARDLQPESTDGVNAAVSAQTVRGRIAVQAGKLDEALEAFKKAAELQPKNPANYFNLALLYLRRNELSEAEKSFDQVIALDPSETDVYMPLGDLLEKTGREEEAIQTYERLAALGAGPLTTQAQYRIHLLKGILLGKQNRFDEARAEFEEAVRISPQEKVGYFNLGLANLKRRDPYAAVEVFKKAMEIDPKDKSIRLRLAALYEELGRPYDAFDLYQGLLEEGGDDVPAEEIQERLNLLFGTISVAYQVTYDSNITLTKNPFGDLKSDLISQYQHYFLNGAGQRSGVRLTPSITIFHHSQVSIFNGQLGLFTEWRGYQRGISLGYTFQVGYFEGSLSNRSHEISVDAFSPIGQTSTFTGALKLRYADSVVNNIYDGIQPSLSAGVAKDGIWEGRLTLSSAVYANFNTKSIGNDYAYAGFSPSILYDRPLIPGVNLNLSYGYSLQHFLNADSDFHKRRLNQGHSISGGVTVNLERGIQFYLRALWQVNNSNLGGTPPELQQVLTADKTGSLSNYSKWLGMFGVRLLF